MVGLFRRSRLFFSVLLVSLVVASLVYLNGNTAGQDVYITTVELSIQRDQPQDIPLKLPDFSSHGLRQSLAKRSLEKRKKITSSLEKSLLEKSMLESRHRKEEQPESQNLDFNKCPPHLDDNDIQRWKTCTFLARKAVKQNSSMAPHNCQFLQLPLRDPVALISLPGSGNTWVRGLLETATGYCTGGVYCDISLRAKGFIGEFIRSGHALVVKTHAVAPKWGRAYKLREGKVGETTGYFGSAILLVRDPFDALVAEWNRKIGNNFHIRTTELESHVKAAGPEWFGKNSMWEEYLHGAMKRWQNTIRHWFIFNERHPALVVRYESLKSNTLHEVERMMAFLGIRPRNENLSERLESGFDAFRRKHSNETFNHFTNGQKIYINEGVRAVATLLDFRNKTHLLDVNQYIR